MQYISKHAIRYWKTSVTCGASFTVDGILLFQNRQFCCGIPFCGTWCIPSDTCIISDYALNAILHIGGTPSTTCGTNYDLEDNAGCTWSGTREQAIYLYLINFITYRHQTFSKHFILLVWRYSMNEKVFASVDTDLVSQRINLYITRPN